MKRQFSTVLALAALSALTVAGCAQGPKSDNAEAKVDDAVAVQVVPAARGRISNALSLSGDIHAERETPVAAKVNGRLETLLVDEGSTVTAGQVIARLDTQDSRLQAAQAEASIASARANLAQAEANLLTAHDNERRYAALAAEGGVSEQQMTSIRSQLAAGRGAVAAAKAQIAQAQATLAIAHNAMANAEVRAPISGRITKKSAEIGQLLSPMTALVTIASTHDLELTVPVGQAYLAAVRVGAPASFSVPTYPDRRFEARVKEIAASIDPASRTAKVKLAIPNAGGALSPGMFARVELPTSAREGALLVPDDALLYDSEKAFVFVAQGDKAVKRPVELGLRATGTDEVTSGLAAGDKVITLGKGQLQDGDRIRITEGAASAPASSPSPEGQ